MRKKSHNEAFTLIELLVVIAIIGILSSVVLASLSGARESARDTKRLQDMRQIQTALEMYYNDHGGYPGANSSDGSCPGAWECSDEDDGEFLDALVDDGYLSNYITDPINDADHNYRYYKHFSSCEDPYYVLGVQDFETVDGTHPDSPGWTNCDGNNPSWVGEWITGSYE